MIRVGPAGWHYDDWAGLVYPAPRPRGFDPLRYLAGYFDTIELNSTFYRPAAEKTARSWAARVEANPRFRFTAKLWRRFTHQRKEAWTQDEVDQVRAGLDPLHRTGRLGAVLLQFPWSFRRTDENRDWLGDVADAFAAYPLVIIRTVSHPCHAASAASTSFSAAATGTSWSSSWSSSSRRGSEPEEDDV